MCNECIPGILAFHTAAVISCGKPLLEDSQQQPGVLACGESLCSQLECATFCWSAGISSSILLQFVRNLAFEAPFCAVQAHISFGCPEHINAYTYVGKCS